MALLQPAARMQLPHSSMPSQLHEGLCGSRPKLLAAPRGVPCCQPLLTSVGRSSQADVMVWDTPGSQVGPSRVSGSAVAFTSGELRGQAQATPSRTQRAGLRIQSAPARGNRALPQAEAAWSRTAGRQGLVRGGGRSWPISCQGRRRRQRRQPTPLRASSMATVLGVWQQSLEPCWGTDPGPISTSACRRRGLPAQHGLHP